MGKWRKISSKFTRNSTAKTDTSITNRSPVTIAGNVSGDRQKSPETGSPRSWRNWRNKGAIRRHFSTPPARRLFRRKWAGSDSNSSYGEGGYWGGRGVGEGGRDWEEREGRREVKVQWSYWQHRCNRWAHKVLWVKATYSKHHGRCSGNLRGLQEQSCPVSKVRGSQGQTAWGVPPKLYSGLPGSLSCSKG